MTTTALDDQWLADRIAATKALIIATEAAITQVAAGAQSYTLDSGQTRQSVTRGTLGSLRLSLDQLDNRLATLDARRCGAGVYARPMS